MASRLLTSASRSTTLAAATVFTCLVLLAASATAANAKTWYVAPTGSGSTCASNSSSSPFGTVQAALDCADNGDTIVLAPSGSTPYLGIGPIDHNVTIKGSGNAQSVAVNVAQPADGSGYTSGLASVPAGVSATLQGLAVECSNSGTGCLNTQCETGTGVCSGSLVLDQGALSLDAVAVTGAANGAGVDELSTGSTAPQLTVNDSTITGNANSGLNADGSMAGGISMAREGSDASPTATVTNSTIAGNSESTSSAGAGGIYDGSPQAGALSLVNDTITANTGDGATGGLVVPTTNTSADAVLSNTLLAGNTTTKPADFGADCGGTLGDGSGGHNLIGDDTDCAGLTDDVNGDLVGVPSPGLMALAGSGGPTQTVALTQQSPAIGAGNAATCQAAPISDRDQRGDQRHSATRGCDIGAWDGGADTGVAGRTWYVSPSGSDTSCASNSSTAPFGTVQAALNCAANGDVISLASSGSRPYPGIGTVNQSVTIEGSSPQAVKVDVSEPVDSAGFSAGNLIIAAGASVRLQGLTVQCGSAGQGCISQGCESSGVCTLALVTNDGALYMDDTTVTGARMGPGIENISTGATPARLTVTDSTVSHNTDNNIPGNEDAAGISSVWPSGDAQPEATVSNSTIADNTGDGVAGGVFSNAPKAGSLTLVNDTIADNASSGAAGGVGGDSSAPQAVQLSNTLVAGNTGTDNGSPDCSGLISDGAGGHNLIGDDTGCSGLSNGSDGDQVGTGNSPIDGGLAPLALNGGPSETMPLLSGSPAIGAGDAAVCEAGPIGDSDERGDARNASSRNACDIGADDTGGSSATQTAPSISSSSSADATESKAFSFEVEGSGAPTPVFSETGNLPSGVTFTDNGNGTATVAGTPAAGTTGGYPITITADNGVAPAATQSFTLTVAGAASVSSISPATFGQGASGIAATISGSGFVSPAKVSVSGPGTGVSIKVGTTSSTSLGVKVSVAAGAPSGSYTLKLTNGDGSVLTCDACVTVVAGPTITGLSPSTVAPREKTTFTVTGTGFSPDAVLSGPKGVSYSGISVNSAGTQITATISVGASAPAGTDLPVTVTDGVAGNDGATTDDGLTIS